MFGCCHLEDALNNDFGLSHDACGIPFFTQFKNELLHHVAVNISELHVTDPFDDAVHAGCKRLVRVDLEVLLRLLLQKHLGEGLECNPFFHDGFKTARVVIDLAQKRFCLPLRFEKFGLPVRAEGITAEEILQISKSDKKMEAGKIKFVLLQEVGNAYVDKTVTDEELIQTSKYILNC